MPFGIATGTDGQVWFTDRGCSGTGHCAVGRIARARVRSPSYGRGCAMAASRWGSPPRAGGEMWFADSAGAIGEVSPGGQITEHTRGLRAGSSPVAVAAGPDGAVWFTDEGQMPAVGRVTAGGAIREFSAGVQAGKRAGGDHARRRREAVVHRRGQCVGLRRDHRRDTPAAQRTAPRVSPAPRPGIPATCTAGRFATWMGLQPSATAFAFDGFRWRRNDILLGGHRGPQFTPSRHDAGARLSCREIVTYPPPLSVTVAATSAPRRLPGGLRARRGAELGAAPHRLKGDGRYPAGAWCTAARSAA